MREHGGRGVKGGERKNERIWRKRKNIRTKKVIVMGGVKTVKLWVAEDDIMDSNMRASQAGRCGR